MFWPFRSRKSETSEFKELTLAAAEGAKFDLLCDALFSIGISYDPRVDDHDFVADGASKLFEKIGTPYFSHADDQSVVDGLFLLVFSDQFSKLAKCSFEAASLQALTAFFGPTELATTIPNVLSQYNELSRENSKTLKAIQITLGRWIAEPSEDGLVALRELFRIVCESVRADLSV